MNLDLYLKRILVPALKCCHLAGYTDYEKHTYSSKVPLPCRIVW